MSATTLDPKTALVIIDLQEGIATLPLVEAIEGVAAQAAKLASAFRLRGMPVVLVNVAGAAQGRNEMPPHAFKLPPDWTSLLSELDQQPQDLLVTKHSWGAFPGTQLEAMLKLHGVTQIVLAGVATSMGVESTAREAYALGFNVTLAIDAMTDMNAKAHANSIEHIFPRLGETGSTQDILAIIAQRGV